MPTKHRFSHTDFILVSSLKTRRFQGDLFSLTVTRAPAGSPVKIACIVSKKVSKRAVDRNLIKRRARAVFYSILPLLKDPLYIIFYAKKESLVTPYERIEHDIKSLMDRTLKELSANVVTGYNTPL